MIAYLSRLWRYGDLLFWLSAKEIKVRYKLPILGFLWALFVPLATSLILWLVFSVVTPTMPNSRYPFFLFLIVGMFPWNFFSQSVSQATMSILDAGSMIKKTAFPRAIVPLSIVASNGFNFVLTLLVVVGVMIASRVPLSPWLLLLPFAVVCEVLFTTGIVLLVAGLQVRYRDVKYLTEISLILWFYLTPIFYPLELVAHAPAVLRSWYVCNPLVYLIELYRVVLLGGSSATMLSPYLAVGVSAVICVAMFFAGLGVFRRHESTFADLVMG